MNSLPDTTVIQRELKSVGHADVRIHAFEQLDSTSGWLHQHVQESSATAAAPNDGNPIHLCVTDWQTAGVGRRGRIWQTRPGNITFSLLTLTQKPASELMGLSLVTGIAVAECLVKYLGINVQLKWPNDVVLEGAKLGGLLTELSRLPSAAQESGYSREKSACTRVLTGIGINVAHDSDVVRLGIGATSLESAGVNPGRSQRDVLVGRLAAAVLVEHQRFFDGGWSAFAPRWDALDWLYGREVSIHRDDSTEQAVACGVNDEGALLVELAGEVRPLYSGNVSIRPKQ
jgi:BirA family biotin operon repressor/biotin-[acetyl-CoA-carboxylase] ligase